MTADPRQVGGYALRESRPARPDAIHLDTHDRGRLATVAADGSPQNKPVGYRHNSELGTIDIGGHKTGSSAKYRNVTVNPRVAFVVDDTIGEGATGMRMLGVRGRAEPAQVQPAQTGSAGTAPLLGK
jgi:pyridoxamine 5'-phosphate oxidase family protein